MAYDIIGDIHGCAETLKALLSKLQYSKESGIYKHADRQVIFLGDFIDRGPKQREVIDIVRPMIESGSALAVMGNHEYNAIAYATRATVDDGYLRAHSDKNQRQHQAFLDAYANTPKEKQEVIEWFMSLPLWLDLGGLRIIHACWDEHWVQKITTAYSDSNQLSEELLHASSKKGTWQYQAIETLLKGKEIPLPDGKFFHDKDGNKRRHIRVRWWDKTADTYRKAFLGPSSALSSIPAQPVEGDHLIHYASEASPVFLGHYWMEGQPKPLANNIACVDYSVAKPGGRLVAYRWGEERVLRQENFVSIGRCD